MKSKQRFTALSVLLAGIFIAILFATLHWAAPVRADATTKVYWVEGNNISRSNLDGTGNERILSQLSFPHGIALDPGGGKIYIAASSGRKIQRANLDGSGLEDLVTSGDGMVWPIDVELDLGAGKMYWTDRDNPKIQRANLDGTEIEDLVTAADGIVAPQGLALDLVNGKMYWTDITADKIQRANLDGSEVEDIVTEGLLVANDIAVDPVGGKIYFTDEEKNRIKRGNLDGTGIENIVGYRLDQPYGIVLDLNNGLMYWTNRGSGAIQYANLDGSNVQDWRTDLRNLYGLAIDFGATLNIDKSVAPAATDIVPGQSLTYTIRIDNVGGMEATNVTVNDALAQGLTFVGPVTLDPAQPGAVLAGSAADLPTLASNVTIAQGDSVTLTVPVMVDEGLPGGTVITNVASVTSDELPTPSTDSQDILIANVAPTAEDDDYATLNNAVLSIAAPGVLDNDVDLNGDALSATLDSTVTNGVLSFEVDGSFVYTPTLGFVGTETFTYTVSDGQLTDTAAVTLTVGSPNDAPVASDDDYATAKNTTLTIAAPGVLDNDTDTENDALTAVLQSDVSNGTLQLNADGSFTYTPDNGFTGSDSFTYVANDGFSDSNVATVTILVTNTAPLARNDSYDTVVDEPLSIDAPGVLANDVDDDGDTLEAMLQQGPQHGTVALSPDGSFIYVPSSGYMGADSFTYYATDGTDNSNTATVTIRVGEVEELIFLPMIISQ